MPISLQDTLWDSLPEIFRIRDVNGFTYRVCGLLAFHLEQTESKILALHKSAMNPDECDEEFLPWLASWVALMLDVNWSVAKQRELIKRIVGIYSRRGTPGAVKELVEIYTGIEPVIVEHFKAGWQVGVRSTVGVDIKIFGGRALDAHRFTIEIYTNEPFDAVLKEKVRQVVLREKPSWTQLVNVVWVQDIYWRVGVRSTVGVDIIVG